MLEAVQVEDPAQVTARLARTTPRPANGRGVAEAAARARDRKEHCHQHAEELWSIIKHSVSPNGHSASTGMWRETPADDARKADGPRTKTKPPFRFGAGSESVGVS